MPRNAPSQSGLYILELPSLGAIDRRLHHFQDIIRERQQAAPVRGFPVRRRILASAPAGGCKAEHSAREANPRFIVTILKGAPQWLYDRMYCVRGDMENRIKEQQLDLFADRTSCHDWRPNQYRLLLSALACTLLEAVRRIALSGSELANAYVGTIRLKLLKIVAVVLRNTRRVRLLLSSSYPHQALFHSAAVRLKPG